MINRETLGSMFRIGSQMLNVLIIALGLAGGYFMTLQSLKLELAAKAETVVVETLDKRLGALEIILNERTVSRAQFYDFARDIDNRLARIEYLIQSRGETGGN